MPRGALTGAAGRFPFPTMQPTLTEELRAAAAKLRANHGDGASPARCEELAQLLQKAAQCIEGRKPTAAQLFLPAAVSSDESVPSLRFCIPTPPSSKNMKKIGRAGDGRAIIYRDADVVRATREIQAIAFDALRRQAPKCIAERRELLPDEDARVTMVHNVRNETLDVLVEKAGPAPSKRDGASGRKRDVVNLPELVLDAIQCPPRFLRGIAFKNDRQVTDLRVWRNVGTPTTEESW